MNNGTKSLNAQKLTCEPPTSVILMKYGDRKVTLQLVLFGTATGISAGLSLPFFEVVWEVVTGPGDANPALLLFSFLISGFFQNEAGDGVLVGFFTALLMPVLFLFAIRAWLGLARNGEIGDNE